MKRPRKHKTSDPHEPIREEEVCAECGKKFVPSALEAWTAIIMKEDPTCSSECYHKRYPKDK